MGPLSGIHRRPQPPGLSARELGRAGELAAARLLRRRGFEIVGQGFLARRGEIDLLCRRGAELFVFEVKARTSTFFGQPWQAVGSKKRRALASAAAEYRALGGWHGPIRFGVVSLVLERDGRVLESDVVEDPF